MNVIENFSKGGFVGQVQPNSLIHADCLDAMKYIEPKSIDMILCDLPYGTTACKWDVVIPFEPLWEQYERIIKDNGAIVLFASQPFTSLLGASNIKALKYAWVWSKTKPTNFANAKKMPLKGFEDILVFYRNLPTYNPQGLQKVDIKRVNTGTQSARSGGTTGIKGNGDITTQNMSFTGGMYIQEWTNYPRGIIEFGQDSPSLHPTQKPVALLEYLIKTYTNEGETVLDNCAGSGSTGVACLNTKRKFIGIEKDDKYFEVAKKRINEQVLTLF